MGNKVTSVNSSKLLDNKLAVLLEKLNEDLKDSDLSEREELLLLFNKAINTFYKTLSSPIFSFDTIIAGTFTDYNNINNSFTEVGQDLDIIYREINSLHQFVINNFNTLNTQSSLLRNRLRRVSSQLGDFSLYSKDSLGGAIYFSDQFTDATKIDYTNKLYNEKKCSIDPRNGIITLPIDLTKTEVASILQVSIGANSNGLLGNNQQLSSLYRGELKSILDNNPDTWVEYESVTTKPSNISLLLDIKIKLGKESIVNTIEFSTIAFAVKKYASITNIEVSVDGKEFTSIMSDIITKVDTSATGSKIIILNPSSSKYSGEEKISFTPRKIKYINISFIQNDAYLINTTGGIRYRKAIGIRDINLSGKAYTGIGEIVSTNYYPPDEMKKLSLIANEYSTQNLTEISHSVSHDNGQNWYDIQSIEKIDKDIKEILNFNLLAEDSIITPAPVNRLRYKALLKRSDAGFSGRGGTIKVRKDKTEFITVSPSSQFIPLEERPINSTVNITNISFGSVGRDTNYLINTSVLVEANDRSKVYLSHDHVARESIEQDSEIITIKNEIWSRVDDLSTAGPVDKVYEFDYLNNIITFGDNTNGVKPDTDILFRLDRYQVYAINDNPVILKLPFPSDRVKESMSIYRLEDEKTTSDLIFKKGATIHRLNQEEINSIAVVNDPDTILVSEETYINGSQELSSSGDYSISYKDGIIYTYDLSPIDADTKINFTYNPRTEIEDYSFNDDDIEITNADYKSKKVNETVNIGANTNVIYLTNSFIEQRSIIFVTLSDSFTTEVPYKGDGTEFNLDLTAAELDGYYTVDYKKGAIYTYSQVIGSLILNFNITNYYAEYNIGAVVPRISYIIDEEEKTISLTDKYIIDTFSSSLIEYPVRTLFKVEYQYATELDQNARELERFYTPVLNEYTLSIVTKEQLL